MPKSNGFPAIADSLRIVAERGRAGDRLPSVRELMAAHSAGPATIQRAMAQLAREGLVETRPGAGTFVAARVPSPRAADLAWQTDALGEAPVAPDPLVDLLRVAGPGELVLSCGYPEPELQATAELRAAASRALRRPAVWDRAPVEGDRELRAWFAREAGGALSAHDVLVCSGGQAALATAFRAFATSADAPVIVESPTYVGALVAARAAGLRPVPVPSGPDGPEAGALANAFARTGARLCYLQPTYSNPHGALMPADRRAEILAVVAEAGAFAIEDDWARDLGLDAEPPPPLVRDDATGHVVYVRSLTKSTAPGLRVAALCARGAARARLRGMRTVDDLFVPLAIQETALELVGSAAWQRHLRRMRRELRVRRDALVASLRSALGDDVIARVPSGGLHLWLRLPSGIDDLELAATAARAGIVVSPGRHWFPAEAPAPHLRLSFGGAPAGVLSEAAGTLARLIGEVRP